MRFFVGDVVRINPECAGELIVEIIEGARNRAKNGYENPWVPPPEGYEETIFGLDLEIFHVFPDDASRHAPYLYAVKFPYFMNGPLTDAEMGDMGSCIMFESNELMLADNQKPLTCAGSGEPVSRSVAIDINGRLYSPAYLESLIT